MMKKLLLFLFLLTSIQLIAQQNLYRYKDTINNQIYYYIVNDDSMYLHGPYYKFNENNRLITRGYFNMNEKDSLWENLNAINGKPYSSGYYKKDKKTGEWKLMDANEKIVFQYNYDTYHLTTPNDSIYSPKYLNKNKGVSDSLHTVVFDETVDRIPLYYGGFKLLYRDISTILRYPAFDIDNENQGTVYVNIVVNEDGSVANLSLKKSSGFTTLDREAIRTVNFFNENWLPAIKNGKAVKSFITIPIVFKLK